MSIYQTIDDKKALIDQKRPFEATIESTKAIL